MIIWCCIKVLLVLISHLWFHCACGHSKLNLLHILFHIILYILYSWAYRCIHICVHTLSLPMSDRLSSVTLKTGQSQLLIFAAYNDNQTCYSISTDALTYISKDFLAYQYISLLCLSLGSKNQWNNLIQGVCILNENRVVVVITNKYFYLQFQNIA